MAMRRSQIIGVGLMLLAVLACGPGAPATRADDKSKAEELTPAQREQLEREVKRLTEEMDNQYKAGRYAEAAKLAEHVLAVNKRLYPPEQYPDGHSDLAQSLNNLGFLLKARGRDEEALPYYEQALAMRRKLYPQGHPDLAVSLSSLGHLLHDRGRSEEAQPYLEQALAMRRKLYPQGHPDLARSLNNLGALLQARGRSEEAQPYLEQALAMRRKLYPQGHPDLAQSLNNLGFLLMARGRSEEALPYYEQALAMFRRFYPQGHPDLARSLNNLGALLQARGRSAEAQGYYEQALAMFRRFYPQGHPDLAFSLNNLGALLQARGRSEEALPYLEQALAMRRKLYPQGHPDLAQSLNNLGYLLKARGRDEEAQLYYEQALAMRRKLYPQGHPDLALSLSSLGFLLQARGRDAEAQPYYEQALALYQGQVDLLAGSASEADALAFARSLPRTRDALLSVAAHLPGADAMAYGHVWPSKAAVTRVLQRRHLARRSADTPAAQRPWRELLDTRSELSRLLLSPGPDPADRDRRLRALTASKERLERELAAALPELPRQQELDRLGPADLAQHLPAGAAFIDLLAYTRFEQDPQKPGAEGERRIPSYTAFVLAPGRPIQRVELGDARPIGAAVRDWRQAIAGWRASLPDADRLALEQRADRTAAEVGRLVWQTLAEHLPGGTRTVYLAPDGDLARLPWAALPGTKPGTVLLEDYALAVVPHGPALLEQLLYPPPPAGPDAAVLAVGGVHPDLPATAREVERLKALAGPRAVCLRGAEATPERVRAELPKARFAHLATHGFFAEDLLAAEKRQIEEQLKKRYEFQVDRVTLPVGLGAQSPLAYTGLVLAGAGRDAQAGDRGVVTGEVLVELPLEHLRLAVLSACETGLGELTGGEGVQGLVRAFHLAGCPDVVASLWSVNDDATAALMAEFYRQLWQESRPPIEALRQAQLLIYRHPEKVRELAERGAPDLSQAQLVNTASAPAPVPAPAKTAAGRSPPKWWAAFVLSGAGR
jgi:CHAT domain-containing protein/tetratricopeptide (TPR) repeat protein